MNKTLFEAYKEILDLSKGMMLPEIEARMLLCKVNELDDMSSFYFHQKDEIKDKEKYENYLKRYLNGEPIQYILEEAEFVGRNFYVNRDVLIPRMETEEVVIYSINKCNEIFGINMPITALDLCCGSGCIAIILKHELNAEVYASDINEKCLSTGDENTRRHNIKVHFLLGDLLKPAIEKELKFDLIVSNPPYIVNKDEIDERTINFEPVEALYPIDRNVVELYEEILRDSKLVLKDKSILVLEIGYDLKDSLRPLAEKYYPNSEIQFIKDINGKDRILSIITK